MTADSIKRDPMEDFGGLATNSFLKEMHNIADDSSSTEETGTVTIDSIKNSIITAMTATNTDMTTTNGISTKETLRTTAMNDCSKAGKTAPLSTKSDAGNPRMLLSTKSDTESHTRNEGNDEGNAHTLSIKSNSGNAQFPKKHVEFECVNDSDPSHGNFRFPRDSKVSNSFTQGTNVMKGTKKRPFSLARQSSMYPNSSPKIPCSTENFTK